MTTPEKIRAYFNSSEGLFFCPFSALANGHFFCLIDSENAKKCLHSNSVFAILTLRAGNTTTEQAYGQRAGESTLEQAAVQ